MMKRKRKRKIPVPYKFDGGGIRRWFYPSVVEMVAFSPIDGTISTDLTIPGTTPWFKVRIAASWGYVPWTRHIITDGEVYHNMIWDHKREIKRIQRHRTRTHYMNESNRLAIVEKIKEFVKIELNKNG